MQLSVQFMQVKMQLLLSRCMDQWLEEGTKTCSDKELRVRRATVRLTTGMVYVQPLSMKEYARSGNGFTRRHMLQTRSFQWSHSVLSSDDGSISIGAPYSSLLAQGPPLLHIEVKYGDHTLYLQNSLPHLKVRSIIAPHSFKYSFAAACSPT